MIILEPDINLWLDKDHDLSQANDYLNLCQDPDYSNVCDQEEEKEETEKNNAAPSSNSRFVIKFMKVQ